MKSNMVIEYCKEFGDGSILDIMNEIDNIEILNEVAIYSNNKYSMHMDGMISASENYYRDPYVKIIDGPSWTKSKNCLLFFFKDSTIGYHNEGKGDLRFNKEIGNFITESLKSTDINGTKIVDKLNKAIEERYKGCIGIYKIKAKDYTNATYRTKPTRREY